jgi:predicted nuclease of predicted toxin-antitoxin system
VNAEVIPEIACCWSGPRIDTDFGQFIFLEGQLHSGLIRLPDVPTNQRVEIIRDLIERFENELEASAIITVRGAKIRISQVAQ